MFGPFWSTAESGPAAEKVSLDRVELDPRFGVMLAEKSIKTSITLHGALFFISQAALLLIVTMAYRMGWPRFALFLGISAAYHGLLTGLLVIRSPDFHVEPAARSCRG